MIKQIRIAGHPLPAFIQAPELGRSLPAHGAKKNRRVLRAAGLCLWLALGLPAFAVDDGPSPAQLADWGQRLEKAAALMADGKARQSAAEEVRGQKDGECYKRFLVNACRADVEAEYVKASREGKRLENEGKSIELQVKKEQLADKDARRRASAPEREAEMKAREAETAAERQAAEAESAATLTDKAKKAEEGTRRRAADAERQRKKREEHDARVATQMEKARRKAAEVDADKK